MKCFYHDDLDGKAAAFCVHAWVGIRDAIVNCNVVEYNSLIPINYGMPFPIETIRPNEQIWIVDYSVNPEEMLKLLEITKDVTWIDHHKTAIEKYKDFPQTIKGIRKDGEAGCVLTFKYIHWWSNRGDYEKNVGNDNVDEAKVHEIPKCILLVGDRDIWAWKYKDETKYFFDGSQLYDTSPISNFWWDCMEHEIKPLPPPNTGNITAQIRGEKFWLMLLHEGKTIGQYKSVSGETVNQSIGYETEFEGHTCWAVNRARIGSDNCGDRIKKYDILLPHYHDGKHWTVSLYSEKIDVSEIAKKYNGGGHKRASGFQCEILPFSRA